MWEMIAFITIWASPPQAPYVSCIDGHIVQTLDQCPISTKHQHSDPKPYGGGGSGLLGLGIGGIL
jgi:hypothetical protein